MHICIRNAEEAENDIVKDCFEFLDQAEIPFLLKEQIFHLVNTEKDRIVLLSQLQAMETDADLLGALTEIISAS